MSDSTSHTLSTKPYLLRAIYEWCTDNGYTPYVAVFVNTVVRVPMEYVKNGEIVLNISFEATQGLKIDNDAITFRARFAGVARDIYIPIDNVVAIYARENGQGMAFPLSPELQKAQGGTAEPAAATANMGDHASDVAPISAAVKPRKARLSAVDEAGAATTDDTGKASKGSKRKAESGAKSDLHAVSPLSEVGDSPSSQKVDGDTSDGEDDQDPPPTKPGKNGAGSSRPTLKRVK